MKKEKFHPEFPSFFDGVYPVLPSIHNRLKLIIPMAEIPLYIFEKEGSKEREDMEMKYWKGKDKKYQEVKNIYEKYCFVGTVFYGSRNTISAKITKIFISDKIAYVCYKASNEHIAQVERDNKANGTEYKPLKSGKYSLISFLSAISSGLINIGSVPEGANKNKSK